VDRAEAGKSALQKLRDRLFEGSSALLLAQLVSDRKVDEREIRRLRELLDARLRERGR
jgi:predicted transcriptional regulator